MICGNAALLYESPDEPHGRKLRFSRSMMDRFHEDASLDHATHLREAQRRRAGYLADLKKRDHDQQRGRRCSTNPNIDRAEKVGKHSHAPLLDVFEAEAGAQQQHRKVYDGGSSGASATGSQSSPRFSRPPSRPLHPTRPSSAIAAAGRAKSPSRPGRGSCPKENRQAAAERAVRVYSAGAGIANGGRRSPTRPLPAWDNRSPSPSTEQQRRRLSPREHGRRPVNDASVRKAGKACSEVAGHGDLAAEASNGLSDRQRRPARPATGDRPSKSYSRPISAFAGRWDGDESFPEKPPKSLFPEEREADQGDLNRGERCPVEDKPNSAPRGQVCSPPLGGLRRTRTAEETPAMQRARQLELERLAIEKKELEAQLAEVKQLMRASKVRAKAVSGGPLVAAVEGSPRESRGRTSARCSRQARGRRSEERRRGSTSPSTNDAAGAPRDSENARPRGKREQEQTEGGRGHPAAGDVPVRFDRVLPGGAGEGGDDYRRGSRRRKRKRGGERGRSRSRRRQTQVLRIRSATPENEEGRRRTFEDGGTMLVAFNTCVSVNRPFFAEWVQGAPSPRGNNITRARGGDSGTRRLRRPKSASRRSRSAPRPSIALEDNEVVDGLVGRAKPDEAQPRHERATRPASDRPRSRASKNRKNFHRFALAKDRDPSQGGGERRLLCAAQYFAGGNRSSANTKTVPGDDGTSTRSKPTEKARARTTALTSAKGAEKSYEDFFEDIGAHDDSYESDLYESAFEPYGDSESLRGSFEGEERTAHHRSTRPRARGSGMNKGDSRAWSERERPTGWSSGGGGVDPAVDSFFRDGEKWSDGQQQRLNYRGIDGGAASWAEWNQPDDDESGGFASSGEWDTREPEAAKAQTDSREGNRRFDHLWVDQCDNVLRIHGEDGTDMAVGPREYGRDQKQNLGGSLLSSSYEECSADTAGGPPSLACPPRLADDGHGKPSLGANAGVEERVSTASMSDGGASLYDILLSSGDDSYSDETWSLESNDRRDDVATSTELGVTAAPRAAGFRAKRRFSAAAEASSNGSSLYDVTSQSSDKAPTPQSREGGPLTAHQLVEDTSLSRALTVEDDSLDESFDVLPQQLLDVESNPTDDQSYPERAGIGFLSTGDAVAATSASLDELSPLGNQVEVHRETSAGGSFSEGRREASPDEYFNGSTESFEFDQGHVIDSSQVKSKESTDRPLTEKGGQASVDESFNGSAESVEFGQGRVIGSSQVKSEESTDRPLAEGAGESSVDEYFNGSAESVEFVQGRVIGSSQVKSEESTDRPLAEGAGESSVDEYFNGSAESVEFGQGHVIDSSPVKSEESTDRPLAEGAGESSVDEYFNGSAESVEFGQGHVIDSSQVKSEESTDRPLAEGAGEASVDEYFNGSAESVEFGHGHVIDSSPVKSEESADRPLAEGAGEASVDEYFNGSAESFEFDQGHVINNSQVKSEESTDRPLAEGAGESSVDEYFNGSVESVGFGQGHVINNSQVEPEESLDELSSLEKQGGTNRGEFRKNERESVDGAENENLPAGGEEGSLDEYLFDGGASSYEDLLSLGGSSNDGGRSLGWGTAIEKHSLDESLGDLSSSLSDGGNPLLYKDMSLGGSATSDVHLGGDSSEDVAERESSWGEIP